MQGKQADPTGNMNRILMGVIALHGNFVGDIMYGDHPVETDQ